MDTTKLPKMLYGGDYNPEQWEASVWPEDMRLFELAGMNIATVNVFSWAMLQPNEDTYDFDSLDRHYGHACRQRHLCMPGDGHRRASGLDGPQIPRCSPRTDFEGRQAQIRRPPQFLSEQSDLPQIRATRLADKLAERYQDHPGAADLACIQRIRRPLLLRQLRGGVPRLAAGSATARWTS